MTATSVDMALIQSPHVGTPAAARLRDALLSERSVQEALVVDQAATATELAGQGDVGSIMERELADASAALARDAIADIDEALAHIGAGTYGVCQSCGAQVPLERLEAIPHTRFCVACAADRSTVLRRAPGLLAASGRAAPGLAARPGVTRDPSARGHGPDSSRRS